MALSPAHRTLVANTPLTISFDSNFGRVEVLNVDGAGGAPIYVSNTGVDPTVGADGFHIVGGAAGAFLEVDDKTSGNTVVKLISAGTPFVSVRGV